MVPVVSLLPAIAVLGLAHADVAEPAKKSPKWNWRRWCHQRHLDKNFTGCMVDSRTDFPAIRSGSSFEVFVAEHYLSAAGRVGKLLGLTHVGLWLREVPGPGSENASFGIEYAAIDFGIDALVPEVEPGDKLVWGNQASISWYPETNKAEWLAAAKLERMGSVNSSTMQKWFRWAVEWNAQHAGYSFWSVWDQPDVVSARLLLPDSICHTFAEDGLIAMYKLGAQLDQRRPVCRNYVAFIGSSTPQIVNMSDARVRRDVAKFYRSFRGLLNKPRSHPGQFGHALVSFVLGFRDPHFYIYQHTSRDAAPRYWRANLSWPYFNLRYDQRMILPWQNTSVQTRGECLRPLGPSDVSASTVFRPSILV